MMSNAFVIIKPDGLRHLEKFECTVHREDLRIKEVYFIQNWKMVAKNIYKMDWLTRRSSPSELETELILSNYFFGNNALVIVIKGKKKNEEDLDFIKYGDTLKRNFRADTSEWLKHFVTIAINVDLLKLIQPIDVYQNVEEGQFYSSLAQNTNRIVSASDFWNSCYFNHIHAPDPSYENVEREWELLVELEVISNKNLLSQEDWEFMKKYRCPIFHGKNSNKTDKTIIFC